MIITLIAISIFTLYMGMIFALYGIPPSVSETFYLLPKKANGLFTAFCWGVSAIIAPWLDATPDTWQFLAFLSVGGLCFVGTAAQFKEDFVKRVHYGGAGVCMAASQLWIFLAAGLWWVSVGCLLAAAVACFYLWRRAWQRPGRIGDKQRFPNVVFWAEMWAFVSLFISLVITLR